MSVDYRHSKVIQSIKGVDEHIKGNYSSQQLIQVLDDLIIRTITPIIETTNYVDQVISNLITWYSENSRRKISIIPKDKLLLLFMMYLATDDPRLKLRVLKRCRLERSIFFTIIDNWLSIVKGYPALTEELTKKKSKLIFNQIKQIESKVAYTGKNDLYSAIPTVSFWYKQSLDFKNQILQKYMRLVVKNSQAYYAYSSNLIELDDLTQNLIMAVSKAIDKYDVSKGVLTSYIKNWLMNAKGASTGQEYGVAYNIPQVQRKAYFTKDSPVSNIGVSLEDDEALNVEDTSMEEGIERRDTINRVRILAKAVDKTGTARMLMGIQEVLTCEQIARLKSVAVK